MNLRRINLIFLILISLTGCYEKNVIPENMGIKSISVLAAFPDSLKVQHRGLTVAGNKIEKIDVSSWNLNSFIEKKAIQYLNERNRFSIIKNIESIDRNIYTNYMPFSATSVFKHKGRKKEIQDIAKIANTDLIMIINTNILGDHDIGPEFINDFGIFQSLAKAYTYVTFQMIIYDTTNSDEVARNKSYLKLEREFDPKLKKSANINQYQLDRTKSLIFEMTNKLIQTTLNNIGI